MVEILFKELIDVSIVKFVREAERNTLILVIKHFNSFCSIQFPRKLT